MAIRHHGLTDDAVIALATGELIRQLNEWIGTVEDDDTMDALDVLTSELLERFAPEPEYADHERHFGTSG